MPPTTEPMARRHLPLLILGAVVVILLLIGAYFALFQKATWNDFQTKTATQWYNLTAPHELRDAAYLLTPQNGSKLYSATGANDIATANLWVEKDEYIIDAVRTGTHTAMIVRSGPTGSSRIVLDGTTVTTVTARIGAIALSPDASKIAFAQAASTTVLSKTSAWMVNVVDTKGTQLASVPAFAAFFDADGNLIALTSSGIVRYDAAGKSTLLAGISGFGPKASIAQSPDRSLLAVTMPYGTTDVYKISSADVTVVRSVDVPHGSLALSNGSLYLLATTEKGTSLTRYSLGSKSASGSRVGSSALTSVKLIF